VRHGDGDPSNQPQKHAGRDEGREYSYDFGNGTRNIFVEDPNGMKIELFERTK
jgi:hypothetical protein